MQNRSIHLLVAVVIAALVVLSGCETLGLASPFSDGADAFTDAQYDWGDKDYSSALRNAALAVYYDEKHYGAYKFIVEKYAEGMEKIQEQLDELAAGEPTVESVAREVQIYVDLADFVDSLDDGTDPRIVTFRKDQIEIPMTDYAPQISQARSRGYELALTAGTNHLESGDVDAADETFGVLMSTFVERTDEKREAAGSMISGLFADRAEAIMANMSYDVLEPASKLLSIAKGYHESERVADLQAAVDTAGMELVFGEADAVASAGTIQAYEQAIDIGKQAYDFTSNEKAVDERIAGYATKALAIADRHVREAEAAYDGTRTGQSAVYSSYDTLLTWLEEWPEATGYEDALDRLSAFIETSKIRVYLVADESFESGLRSRVLTDVRRVTREESDRAFYFHTSADLEELDELENSFVMSGWNDLYNDYDGEMLPDDTRDYQAKLRSLSADSSTEELEAMGIDYIIRVSANPGRLSSDTATRHETIELDACKTTEGEINDERAIMAAIRVAKNEGASTYRTALEESDIAEVWFGETLEVEFARTSGSQDVRYTVSMERVSDGRRVYNGRFSDTLQTATDEVLTSISGSNEELRQFVASKHGGVREVPELGKPGTTAVTKAFEDSYEPEAIAKALVRSR